MALTLTMTEMSLADYDASLLNMGWFLCSTIDLTNQVGRRTQFNDATLPTPSPALRKIRSEKKTLLYANK